MDTHPISFIRGLVAIVASYQTLTAGLINELRSRDEALNAIKEDIGDIALDCDCVEDVNKECLEQARDAKARTEDHVGKSERLFGQASILAGSLSEEMPFTVSKGFEVTEPESGTPDLPKFELPRSLMLNGVPGLENGIVAAGFDPNDSVFRQIMDRRTRTEGRGLRPSTDRDEQELAADNGGTGFGSRTVWAAAGGGNGLMITGRKFLPVRGS